jgi:hypothetical protein
MMSAVQGLAQVMPAVADADGSGDADSSEFVLELFQQTSAIVFVVTACVWHVRSKPEPAAVGYAKCSTAD